MDHDGAAAQNILMLAHLHQVFPYLPAAPREHHPVWKKSEYQDYIPVL